MGVTVRPVTPRMVNIAPEVVHRRLGDEMVLVHLKSNQIFQFNETSARLWELLVEAGDIEAAELRMAEEYDVDSVQLRREIATTVALLLDERLITEKTGE
jgi:Coenzyme PQQ synthesis protein D (PqqD)